MDFWGSRRSLERKEGERGGKQRFKSVSNGGMADRDPVPLPAEVRAKLAELELELSEGEYLNFTAELGGCARLCCCCSGGVWVAVGRSVLRAQTGSEFVQPGGKVLSSNCHKFKSIFPYLFNTHTHAATVTALVYLAVIWVQGCGVLVVWQ